MRKLRKLKKIRREEIDSMSDMSNTERVSMKLLCMDLVETSLAEPILYRVRFLWANGREYVLDFHKGDSMEGIANKFESHANILKALALGEPFPAEGENTERVSINDATPEEWDRVSKGLTKKGVSEYFEKEYGREPTKGEWITWEVNNPRDVGYEVHGGFTEEEIAKCREPPHSTYATSDGSTAAYYQLPMGSTELQHLISHKDMNSQIGEIFRSCYRYGEVSHSDKLRDAKKIKFYIEAELERLERL